MDKMSEEECIKKCFDSDPYCAAMDYNKPDGICYLHNKISADPSKLEWRDCCYRYTITCNPASTLRNSDNNRHVASHIFIAAGDGAAVAEVTTHIVK